MKVKISNQFLYYVQHRATEGFFDLFYLGTMGETNPNYTLVYPNQIELEVEVPDDFDPREHQVAAIDRAITNLQAETSNKVTDLLRRKAELLAIEAPRAAVPDPADCIDGHDVPF
jgi:hypothetical protein